MKIGVFIKQVPDTETKIRVKPDGSGIETNGIKQIVNPYCEFAVEEALKTKEKIGSGEVVLVSLGPSQTVDALRAGLAMGADRAIHIDDGGLTLDSFATATLLTQVVQKEGFNLVFCGKQAIDDDAAQVPQIAAEILNWPHVMVVEKFELTGDRKGATVHRRVGGGSKEVYDVTFPAVLGCDKGLNTPRYASLPNIMKAKTKPLLTLKATELMGDAKPRTINTNYRLPPERQAGKMLQGEPEQVVKELVRLLREEAKVI
ncbi:MAG: electron transfer flavoprotein subunit beta/FixA family protein [Deltaproteobacteria bacterium]|nr:electron transfer flavoprotein subunit beta/FixA family protein [Deltaproteobacteria bacterium]